MSEPHTGDEQRPVAPGIAAAMRNISNASTLRQHPRLCRWSLPSDHQARSDDTHTDEH